MNEVIRQEIAAVIQNELRDPQIGFATVIAVDTSPDLKNATVLFSILGDASDKKAALGALNRAAAFIRKLIMPNLTLRTVPKLTFELDDTAERAARISQLLTGSDPLARPEE